MHFTFILNSFKKNAFLTLLNVTGPSLVSRLSVQNLETVTKKRRETKNRQGMVSQERLEQGRAYGTAIE